jgi:hypothetical protein
MCRYIPNNLTMKEKENLKGSQKQTTNKQTPKETIIDSGCSMLGSMIEVHRLSEMVCMMAQRLLMMHEARHKGA